MFKVWFFVVNFMKNIKFFFIEGKYVVNNFFLLCNEGFGNVYNLRYFYIFFFIFSFVLI